MIDDFQSEKMSTNDSQFWLERHGFNPSEPLSLFRCTGRYQGKKAIMLIMVSDEFLADEAEEYMRSELLKWCQDN
jgi:hypothetical protein